MTFRVDLVQNKGAAGTSQNENGGTSRYAHSCIALDASTLPVVTGVGFEVCLEVGHLACYTTCVECWGKGS